MSDADRAEIAVIGGSGFYDFLDQPTRVAIDTPFGAPSEPVEIGSVGGRRVAFVARHGRDHRFPPHRVPYRANLWALHAIGVRQVLAPCAVGSLRGEHGPGTVVVPDQLVDRTSGRAQTFHDDGAHHAAFADPYCATGRTTVLATASALGDPAVDGGTMVVIEGPRFSTRAESRWFSAQGWDLVNMTGHPEAVLARELGLCYTAVALVTDYDAGIDVGADGQHAAVTQDEVFRVFGQNVTRLRTTLEAVIPRLPTTTCRACAG
jgi:5'-methylthioadenosine phosphorylase